VRVLLVAHNFLPAHAAGTEVYTGALARELARRGHAVRVLATEKDVGAPHLSVREREWQGIPVTEVVNNLHYRSFRETWDMPEIDAIFGAVLDRERPEVVHFQHLMYLSIGCVEEAARRGIEVVFTLHDYWLHCPRFGQRIHGDGTLCERIDLARCGECLTSFKFAQTALERWTARALAQWNRATGIDLSEKAKQAARALGLADSPRPPGAPEIDRAAAAELEREVGSRDAAIRERVLPRVARFLAPSRFLLDRVVEWGIEPERIELLRTGFVGERRESAPARKTLAGRGNPLRVAFLGTLAPHKGPQILLEAWSRLDPALRARATLELFGPAVGDRAFADALRATAEEVGAVVREPLPRERVAEELSRIDLLVVPSVWLENAPMVILEAVQARTPVLVSDLGGSRELIEPGRTGEIVRAGDPADLAARLAELLGSPERLERLGGGGASGSPDFSRHVDRVEEVYREAVARPRASRA
jgi:glycosyltransferase involved in cell wall biosynthesis